MVLAEFNILWVYVYSIKHKNNMQFATSLVRYVICENTTTADMRSEVLIGVVEDSSPSGMWHCVIGPEIPMFPRTVVLQGQAKTQGHGVTLQMTWIFSSTYVKTSHFTFPKIGVNCVTMRKYPITQSKEPGSTEN